MKNPSRPTAVATRQFFEGLEQRFGGLPMDGGGSDSGSDSASGSDSGTGLGSATVVSL